MKSVFYGTPEIAVPFLERLARETQVVAVVSQPDKPAGRSLKVEPTPVKSAAQKLGLRVFQPAKPAEIAGDLRALAPDIAVAVAYGRILKGDALAAPRLGTLNVHFSLLPELRGAAPVQWALARGARRTGITIFWLDEGMDTGPVFLQREVEIAEDDDAVSLFEKLKEPSLAALSDALSRAQRGDIIKIPQSGAPSAAPLIKREDARVSLNRPAQEIHNIVRAFCIWPKAYLELQGGKRLIVLKTRVEVSTGEAERAVGQVVSVAASGAILVQCSPGSRLWFLSVQPEGKKPVSAADFINGLRLKAGDVLPILG